eukprot:403342067
MNSLDIKNQLNLQASIIQKNLKLSPITYPTLNQNLKTQTVCMNGVLELNNTCTCNEGWFDKPFTPYKCATKLNYTVTQIQELAYILSHGWSESAQNSNNKNASLLSSNNSNDTGNSSSQINSTLPWLIQYIMQQKSEKTEPNLYLYNVRGAQKYGRNTIIFSLGFIAAFHFLALLGLIFSSDQKGLCINFYKMFKCICKSCCFCCCIPCFAIGMCKSCRQKKDKSKEQKK